MQGGKWTFDATQDGATLVYWFDEIMWRNKILGTEDDPETRGSEDVEMNFLKDVLANWGTTGSIQSGERRRFVNPTKLVSRTLGDGIQEGNQERQSAAPVPSQLRIFIHTSLRRLIRGNLTEVNRSKNRPAPRSTGFPLN